MLKPYGEGPWAIYLEGMFRGGGCLWDVHLRIYPALPLESRIAPPPNLVSILCAQRPVVPHNSPTSPQTPPCELLWTVLQASIPASAT